MPVIRNISIHVDPAQIVSNEGNTDNELIIQNAGWAAETATKLAGSAIVYRILPAAIEAKQLTVAATSLQIGPKIDLLKPAQEVAIGVVTIGAAIEEKINQLNSKNELLDGYLLNCAAFTALDAVALRLKTCIEEIAAQRNWGVGPALSPGTLPGWPTSDQRRLCALVDLSQIEVKINEFALLVPRYSLSFLIGMGSGYDSPKVGSTCHYCSLKRSCQYRHRSERQ